MVARLAADAEAYLEDHRDVQIETLCALIRQPSRTGELSEVRACATMLIELLDARGWRAEVATVDDLAPIVYAECPGPPDTPTLLCYSHYDVITPEPLDGWRHPPFGAVREDGRIYGRGSTDAKANLLSLVQAAEAFVRTAGAPPCGLKLILDGEEERGSSNLPIFVQQYADRLACDAVLSFDGAIDVTGVPKVGLGTSGMLYVELTVDGPSHELHSAGARIYANPAWRLVWALASLKNATERVLIEGFYDPIVPPTAADRAMMSEMAWDDDRHLADAGLPDYLGGGRGPEVLERLLFQPGVAICGLTAGYAGPGPKAIIPATASAKVEFRIVPKQDPASLLAAVRRHLDEHGFPDVRITNLADVETAKTDPGAAIVRAVVDAAEALYGPPLVKPTEEFAGRQGAWLGNQLAVPGVQTGIGPPGARGHATDEFVTEEHYFRGIRFAADIFSRYAGR
jgi:acetylornithine deacetylase/succinyl-diaminopimelate desuccinylase-like protein